MSKPTKPGYWWFREHDYDDFEPVKIVKAGDENLWVKHFNGFSWRLDCVPGDGDEWGGECR